MDTGEVLELLIEVADEVIRPRFQALGSADIDQKSPGDYVTVADREAEVLITAALQRRVPGCLVVGEEATHADPGLMDGLADADLAYVVDPVDGTGNFVRGSAKYAVMVAELRHGAPTRSWIWQPELQRAYVAERGAGCYREGVRLGAPEVGEPPRGAATKRNWRRLDAEAQQFTRPYTNFCAGFDYADLVEGQLDFIYYRNPKPWDHLPGQLMLDEVGGAIIEIGGRRYTALGSLGGEIIAAVRGELATRMAGHWLGDPAS